MTEGVETWGSFLGIVADHELAVLWPESRVSDAALNEITRAVALGDGSFCVSLQTTEHEGRASMVMQVRRLPVTMGDRESGLPISPL